MRIRTTLVYILLITTWLATVIWQHAEHDRVATRLRASLANRAADSSKSLDIMLRAMRFGSRGEAFIPGSRLESAIEEMVKSEELLAISLYNRSFDVIASAGIDSDFSPKEMPASGELWLPKRALFQHPVDLGISNFGTNSRARMAIVMKARSEEERERDRIQREIEREDPVKHRERLEQLRQQIESRLRAIEAGETNAFTGPNQRRRRGFLIHRPKSMTAEAFEELQQQGGVYGTLFQLNTSGIQASIEQDKWLRTCIVAFAFVAFAAMGMAWRNVSRSGEFAMRLVRAREQNTHLRDMNMAAAGLAHETRNPLNLIRGMAQMISKEERSSESIRNQCQHITNEVDRVTGQLNEFINFSKPPEVLRTAVNLGSIIEDVTRPLAAELDDQNVIIDAPANSLRIEADEKMLRQVVFNITLNSLQAMGKGGRISIESGTGEDGAWIEISDNGPGIAEEHRERLFQPYFTTREKEGTGLGLAIVRQIVLAHGWEIAFQPAEPKGAKFRITRITEVSG